jgi:exopolysaccharide biosynthesis polyprenyl glycosylphosphotransferase
MTLFFNPSPGTEWAGAPVAPDVRTLHTVQVLRPSAPVGPALRASAEPWRALFPAFRATAAVREVALSAAAGALVLVTDPTSPAWALVPAVALPVAVAAAGGYRWRTLGEGRAEQRLVLRAGAAVAALLVVLGYLGIVAVPVMLAAVAVPAAVAGLALGRWFARRGVVQRRAAGSARFRTFVLGPASAVRELMEHVAQAPGAGYEVIGWSGSLDGPAPGGVPAFGPVSGAERVAELVAEHAIDVVLQVGLREPTTTRRISWALEGTAASLVVVPGLAEIGSARVQVRPTDDLWTVQLDVAARPDRVPGKGLVDRVLGAALLSVAAFILVPVMLAVRLTSPGSALYKQQRIGRDGVPFTMWKVRSMYVDADARRDALLRERGDGNGLLFKMKADPRITPIGRVLRRLSIDELPQLFNVVRGEMSIVGPRPALAEETSQYEGDEPRRLAVKPGLTGLWQVSGRSDLTREQSMRLDLRYVDNVSLSLDASILARTFGAVSRGMGAY